MKRWIQIVVVLTSGVLFSLGAEFYGITDPIMGEYEGFWTAKSGAKGRLTAQIRALSNNQYDGFVLLQRTKSPVAAFVLKPATAGPQGLAFAGVPPGKESGGDLLAQSEAKCELKAGKLTGTFGGDLGEGSIEAAKIERKSPTLGARPTKNSIVLFDGKNLDEWDTNAWTIQDGALQPGPGNLRARDKIANFRLHLEFRVPFMPAATGQARGNSGVYLQGKYEVQVLDSFGLYPLQDNDCAGVYRVRAPLLNACLPPMEWQTYDITYYDASKDSPPAITVVHNGVMVIEDAAVPANLIEKGTGGGDPKSGFLMLQNHGNPVQFRNIWVEPLNSRGRN